MNTILGAWTEVANFFGQFTWYFNLYWLLLGYFLVWLGALAFTQGFLALRKPTDPIENSVYLAWALAFLLHFIAFVVMGIDSVQLAWFGGVAIIKPGLGILFAILRILPYVVMGIVDVVFMIKLFRAGTSSGQAAPVRQAKRA
jgi:hypothetical protein